MKNKREILGMGKEELNKYKWSNDLNLENTKSTNTNCVDNCYNCSDVVNGLYCRNLRLEKKDFNKYWICNVEVTKEEFEAKKKEVLKE
jgi:hypothetical protein